ncbi:MAG: hypothetical protein IKU86_06490, partial [Thermoguttaceae bacterium]|nr:hypothetical protein [Thermoguttaceae bacterium]
GENGGENSGENGEKGGENSGENGENGDDNSGENGENGGENSGENEDDDLPEIDLGGLTNIDDDEDEDGGLPLLA